MAVALGLAAALSGCNLDPYCINCDNGGGGGGPDGGEVGGDGARDGTVDLDATPLDACLPSGPEVCNGVDDDCDGEVDESPLADVGAACGTEVGACTPGSTECVDGHIVCGNGAVNPEAESCDGLDNDCDGIADDGDPGGGVLCGVDTGDCRRGVTACVDGDVQCVGGQGPVDEVCDGRDNDCDGVIDQGDPEGGGSCGINMGQCAPGTVH